MPITMHIYTIYSCIIEPLSLAQYIAPLPERAGWLLVAGWSGFRPIVSIQSVARRRAAP